MTQVKRLTKHLSHNQLMNYCFAIQQRHLSIFSIAIARERALIAKLREPSRGRVILPPPKLLWTTFSSWDESLESSIPIPQKQYERKPNILISTYYSPNHPAFPPFAHTQLHQQEQHAGALNLVIICGVAALAARGTQMLLFMMAFRSVRRRNEATHHLGKRKTQFENCFSYQGDSKNTNLHYILS